MSSARARVIEKDAPDQLGDHLGTYVSCCLFSVQLWPHLVRVGPTRTGFVETVRDGDSNQNVGSQET